jgi:hypothetical protein
MEKKKDLPGDILYRSFILSTGMAPGLIRTSAAQWLSLYHVIQKPMPQGLENGIHVIMILLLVMGSPTVSPTIKPVLRSTHKAPIHI